MEKLSVDEVKTRLDAGDPLIFIDARSETAWTSSDVQIPNSLRVPPDRAEAFEGAVSEDATIVTYCT
jgi:hypothetical protein